MIILSYILFGVGNIINIGITIRNKMKYLPPTVIGSAMGNHVFNYLLIPSYSMMGAAWATIISRLVVLMVRITVNLHIWYFHYEYICIAKIVLVWGLICGGSLLVHTPNAVLNGGLNLILLATYVLLLHALLFYEKQELIAFKRLFQLAGVAH